MTERAQLQTGKMFRDLDGSVVHLKNIINSICVWTADAALGDGSSGGATHMDNFSKRFTPIVEVVAAVEMTELPASPMVDPEFAFLMNRLPGENARLSHVQ